MVSRLFHCHTITLSHSLPMYTFPFPPQHPASPSPDPNPPPNPPQRKRKDSTHTRQKITSRPKHHREKQKHNPQRMSPRTPLPLPPLFIHKIIPETRDGRSPPRRKWWMDIILHFSAGGSHCCGCCECWRNGCEREGRREDVYIQGRGEGRCDGNKEVSGGSMESLVDG